MKKEKKNYKTVHPDMRCPYCGSKLVLRSADGIYHNNPKNTMLYVCARYPQCDSYVRTHPGTVIPMGTPADGKLRALRHEAHKYFNQLYLSGLMTKDEAYRWLAMRIQAPQSQAHIGYVGEYYCKQIIHDSRTLLNRRCSRSEVLAS